MKTMIINGAMYIDGKEVLFDDLEITEYEEDIEFDIEECDINEYTESCDDCMFCDCNCEDDEEYDTEESLDELIDDYTEVLLELGNCPDCVRNILTGLVGELLGEI